MAMERMLGRWAVRSTALVAVAAWPQPPRLQAVRGVCQLQVFSLSLSLPRETCRPCAQCGPWRRCAAALTGPHRGGSSTRPRQRGRG